jgi:hypothetical protein
LVNSNEERKEGPTPPKINGIQPPSLDDTGQSKSDIVLPPSLSTSPDEEITKNSDQLVESVEKTKRKSIRRQKINPAIIIRRWKVVQKRALQSLQVLMSREFKTNINLTPQNTMYRNHVVNMLNGQEKYLDEMIETIKNGEDELSQELMEKDFDRRASTQVFETLIEIITEERARLIEEKPNIIEYVEKDLKRFKDARLEPRVGFWIIWTLGMQLNEIHAKIEKPFEIVMEVLLRYPPAMRRALGILHHFAFFLVREFEPYSLDSARTKLNPGPGGTGYNMAPWIKYRYSTNSQSYMEYERYLHYYVRSFGIVPGNAPDFENGPKDGYRKWIQRSLDSLDKALQNSPIIVSNARGNTLEGMLAGVIDELEDDIKNREYEPEFGKLINQPIGGEGAIKLMEWLFETAIQRYDTTNISTHGRVRLSLDMFDFLEDTTRWVNEFGEQLVFDWLDPDQE